MGIPMRPLFRPQLNDPTTVYDGLNCGCASTAMAIDVATLGKTRIYGGQVRAQSGDTSGGLTLPQLSLAALHWGVSIEVEHGITDGGYYARLREGRHAVTSGASIATHGTRWQASESFTGNHSWFVNEGRGWHLSAGVWEPDEVLVYDPLADGRREGIAKSPFWLPRYMLERFTSALVLDASTGRKLGPGRMYAGFTKDTEPHAHFKYSAEPTTPFPAPRIFHAAQGRSQVRTGPGRSYTALKYKDGQLGWPNGVPFIAYQSKNGYLGDHGGTHWTDWRNTVPA